MTRHHGRQWLALVAALALVWAYGCRDKTRDVPAAAAPPPPHELYVTNALTNQILVFGPTATMDTAPIRVMGDMTGLNRPKDIAVHPARAEIFVQNGYRDSISVYARTAESNTAPVRTLQTWFTSPTRIAVDTAADEIFVLEGLYVSVHGITAEGNAQPQRVLLLPTSNRWYAMALDLALDTANNELLVLYAYKTMNDFFGPYVYSILVYDREAAGNESTVTLKREITGLPALPTSVAVEPVNNEIFMTWSGPSSDGVHVYERTATGAANPKRTLVGGLLDPRVAEIDAGSNELFVLDGASIKVYARDASGATLPTRTLAGAATGLDSTTGIALDLANSELLAANKYSITAHDLAAEGDTVPKRMLSGAIATGIIYPVAVAADTANNEIYIRGNNYIAVYDKTAGADARPKRRFACASSSEPEYDDIMVDVQHSEVYAANTYGSSVTVYDRLADGDVLPKRTLSGIATGLDYPLGVALDAAQDELYILDYDAIAVFDRTADGDTAPKRVITLNPNTYIPFGGIALDTRNAEVLVAIIDYATDKGAVLVLDMAAADASTPKRVIQGPGTGLDGPIGMALDREAEEIFVLNLGWDDSLSTITVYDRMADGDAAPKRTIGGPASSLFGATGMALSW